MLAGKDLIIQHAAELTDAVQNELDDLMEKRPLRNDRCPDRYTGEP